MEAHDPMYGPQAAYFSELFGTHLCYSGASIGYQLSSVVGRHLAAHRQIAARVRGGRPLVAGRHVMAALSVITLVSTYLALETFEEDIIVEQPEEQGAVASETGRVKPA